MIRQGLTKDLGEVMKITHDAQDKIESEGFDQWQNDYPNLDVFNKDIIDNQLFVYVNNDNCVVAYFVLSNKYEKAYEELEFKTNNSQVIHRIAIKKEYIGNGIGSQIFAYCINISRNNGYDSLKVDTHRDNNSMKALINRFEFEYRGYLTCIDRDAYEKML